MHSSQLTPRCGNKSIVKLLLRPGDRGVGIETSAHKTVVDVVDDVVDVVDDVEEVDVVGDEQVVDGVVVSTPETGEGPNGPKNRSDMATSIETKRIFFIKQTIAMFIK